MEFTEEEICAVYDSAGEHKEAARKSIDKFEFYLPAAKCFRKAAEMRRTVAAETQDINEKSVQEVFSLYCFYEEQYCLSAYNYEAHEIEKAKRHQQLSKIYLDDAINRIKNLPPAVSPETREFLSKRLPRWEFAQKSDRLHDYALNARAALLKQNFVEALDNYRTIISLSDEIINNLAPDFDPELKRIAAGNLIGFKANAAGAKAVITFTLATAISEKGGLEMPRHVFVQLLRHGKDAYLFAQAAFEQNPQSQQYHYIAQHNLLNIQNALKGNSSWNELYLIFEDDAEFLKIMRMTDIEKFSKAEKARHFRENRFQPVTPTQVTMNEPILNNININNSEIGMLNTGSIQNVERIDASVSKLIQGGEREAAQAVRTLAEAIASNQEIGAAQRTELLDQLNEIGNQAALPAEQRRIGVVKPLLNGLTTGIGAAGNLVKVWAMCGDAICGHFGVENPFKSQA